MSIDTGGYDARKTVLSSKEKQEQVFARHREKMKEMNKPQPTAEDWIIARLIQFAILNSRKEATVNPDVVRSVLYLNKKFGLFEVDEIFDALRVEKAEMP